MSGFFAHAPLWHLKGDFWKFWSGQTISTLGSSVTGFVLPLLVFKLTNSPLNLALTMVFTVLPYLLFGLAIGAWVDRINRKRVMICIGDCLASSPGCPWPVVGLVDLCCLVRQCNADHWFHCRQLCRSSQSC